MLTGQRYKQHFPDIWVWWNFLWKICKADLAPVRFEIAEIRITSLNTVTSTLYVRTRRSEGPSGYLKDSGSISFRSRLATDAPEASKASTRASPSPLLPPEPCHRHPIKHQNHDSSLIELESVHESSNQPTNRPANQPNHQSISRNTPLMFQRMKVLLLEMSRDGSPGCAPFIPWNL